MNRCIGVINRIEEYTLSLMLLQMGLAGFLQVVMRYAFSTAITWLDEFVHFEVVMLTFFGAGLGVKYGTHICVDIVKNKVKGLAYDLLDVANHLVVLTYVVIVLYFGIRLISMMTGLVQYTPTLRIPKHYLYVLVWLGYVVIGLRTVIQLYKSLLKLFAKRS
jgi:C4-dicarboxylate transporter, DctQ subunit